MAPRVVVMGVSGTGKTTVGRLLADELELEFADADDFHPPANREKMARGDPLTDEDRQPWLQAIGEWLQEHAVSGAVVTCSALKRKYRDVLREYADGLWFLHLSGSPEVVGERLQSRSDHYMPESLLASQYESLEAPGEDERAIEVDIAQAPDLIVTEFLSRVPSLTAAATDTGR